MWTLYTDGASRKEGSEVGLIIQSSKGEEVTYVCRFDFNTSNNEVEYEALLEDLRLENKMEAERVISMTESRLAASQINREFEKKDKRMEKYVKSVKKLTSPLKRFPVKQIMYKKKRRDALNKLASTFFDHLSKKVLVEVPKERSINECQVNTL